MWYVASPPLGSDTNPGMKTQPFATIQKGIDTATDGNTVVVSEGKYIENNEIKGDNIMLRGANPLDSDVVAISGTMPSPACFSGRRATGWTRL